MTIGMSTRRRGFTLGLRMDISGRVFGDAVKISRFRQMTQSPQPRRVLFICHLNRARSATAERVFCERPDLEVRSAGPSEDAMVRVKRRMLEWADVIFTMDPLQRRALAYRPRSAATARAARAPRQ